MPHVAHNEECILGYGETAEAARRHMMDHHADLEPTVAPATRALVDSIDSDPYRVDPARVLYGDVPMGSSVRGVECLAEEFQVMKYQQDLYGFKYAEVRAEIDALVPAGGASE